MCLDQKSFLQKRNKFYLLRNCFLTRSFNLAVYFLSFYIYRGQHVFFVPWLSTSAFIVHHVEQAHCLPVCFSQRCSSCSFQSSFFISNCCRNHPMSNFYHATPCPQTFKCSLLLIALTAYFFGEYLKHILFPYYCSAITLRAFIALDSSFHPLPPYFGWYHFRL